MLVVAVARPVALIVGGSTLMSRTLSALFPGALALPCRLNQLCSGEGEFERELMF